MLRIKAKSAADFLPSDLSIPSLRAASELCTGCSLYANAHRTVFGYGDEHASVMLLAEQPNEQEDLEGRPFIGPAGRLMMQCLEKADLDKSQIYFTYIVKHYKSELHGLRRFHDRPKGGEVRACMPWFMAELATVRPNLLVCLGATAAQALFGRDFRVTAHRGELHLLEGFPTILLSINPSALLRITGEEERRREIAAFIQDLTKIKPFQRVKAA